MTEYSKAVKEILDKHGWKFQRHGAKASHDIWINPDNGNTVSINKNMKSRHTANDILKRAKVKERFR